MRQLALMLLLLWVTTTSQALETLTDKDLQAISGQAGIALELGLDINTTPAGTPALTDCDTLGGPCRLAISFANRTDEWLVLKGYYGNLSIPTLNLDSAYLSSAASDATLFDGDKFLADDGVTCLLPGGDCSTATLDSMAAIKLSMPAASGSYDSGTGTSNGFTNFTMGLTLTGVAIEFGAGATGYNANANGSFLGMRIADNNGPLTGVNISGDIYIFGF